MRILFLISETGGGHLSSARAMENAFHRLLPGQVETSILDIFSDEQLSPLDRVTKLYEPLIIRAPWLWGVAFHATDSQFAINIMVKMARSSIGKRLHRILRAEKPDVIVSVHPLANHLTLEILAKERLDIPFVTCMVDLVDAHHGWVAEGTELMIAPTDRAKAALVKRGADPSKVEVVGMPVQPKFSEPLGDRKELRQRLGLDPDLFCVFMMGGGAGAGGLFENARAIADAQLDLQLLIACGRNEVLKNRFESEQFNVPVKALGFANNVHELMYASDIVVGKGGPNTIAEALSLGRPLILTSVLPGQEANIPTYLEEEGAGSKVENPGELVAKLRGLLDQPHRLHSMADAARRMGKPTAATIIVERVHKFVRSRSGVVRSESR